MVQSSTVKYFTDLFVEDFSMVSGQLLMHPCNFGELYFLDFSDKNVYLTIFSDCSLLHALLNILKNGHFVFSTNISTVSS